MAKYKYGIKTFTIAEIDPANGAAVVAGALEVTADVKRDTFQMTEEDGTSVDIYSEMDNTPVGSFEEPGKENLVCELLDTTVERLAFFLGGSVVTAGGLKTWSKPANQGTNEKHITIVLIDDTTVTIPRAKVTAKKNFNFRRNEYWSLPISLTPLTPEFPGLASMTISEPE